MKRSLSGIQPSGILHLGNYFGAISQFVKNQNSGEFEGFYFIADYHSLTSLTDPKSLKENTYNIVLDYLALGLNPEKSTIFLQSDIPEHVELSWLLSNVTPVGLLERGHSYKDKIAKGFTPNAGLMTYPVLMAADILIYDTDVVPVGKDQKQHLEMTRDIAMKFNQQYGVDLGGRRIIKKTYFMPIEGFDVASYTNKMVDMFTSESSKEVTLLCENELMRVIIDHYGEDAAVDRYDDTHFTAKIEVNPSGTFYGWIFKFKGKIKILSPKECITEMQQIAQEFI